MLFEKDIPHAPKQKVKSSIQRSLKASLLELFPLLTPYADEFLPKKSSLESMKLPDRCTLYIVDGEPLFCELDRNQPLLPHLRLVHRFPTAFPSVRIDRGAIRFVLSGATLMAPGLTSKGGRLPEAREVKPTGSGEEGEWQGPTENEEDGRWSRELNKGEVVVVMAEGKEHACAVGVLVAGTKEVKETKKGPVIEEAHYLGDGLWSLEC